MSGGINKNDRRPWTIKIVRGLRSELSGELFPCSKFDAFVGAVVDADAFVLDDAIAEHGEQVIGFGEEVDGLQGLRDGAGLDGAVADLCAANRAPHFMSADAGVENFGNGIEGEFAGLGDHHIHDAHEVVGGVHGMEGVVMQEDVQSMRRLLTDAVGEFTGIVPSEVSLDEVFVFLEFVLQPLPIVLVVTEINKERDLVLLDERDDMFDDGFEEFTLCACSTHRQQEAARFFGFHAAHAIIAIRFDVFDQFMVHVVTGEEECIGWGRLQDLALVVKSAHDAEAVITGRRLNRVLGAFGKLECHGPVIEHHIHDVGHAASDRAHAIPHVRGENGHIRRKRTVEIIEEFAHLEVFDFGLEEAPGPGAGHVIKELVQTGQAWLASGERFPDVFVEPWVAL